jgi:hypothetical protein
VCRNTLQGHWVNTHLITRKKERWMRMMTNGRNQIVAAVGFSFLTGCLLGGIAGVLYAPQSGTRTRRKLGSLVDDVQEQAGEMAEDASATIQSVVDRGRRAVNV